MQTVERLDGNIGYVELRAFFPAEAPGAGDAAAAAMRLLAHTGALIIDLRRNHGGDPSMVALLSSYLFSESVHLNSLYWRANDFTQQFWTFPYVPGPRFVDKPVYVLTSGETFSGAEEFTYNLKNLKRATIVGETTGGGAHPGDDFPITPHFGVWVPTGRAVNPITGTNWEGTGVAPDIRVPADEALDVAYAAALRHVVEHADESAKGPRRAVVEEARRTLAEMEGVGLAFCRALWPGLAQPQRDVRRLHGLLDHGQEVVRERAEIDVVPQARREVLERFGRVVFVAVETAIDRALDPAAERLKQRRDRQCRHDQRQRGALRRECTGDLLQQDYAPEVDGAKYGRERAVDQRTIDDDVDIEEPVAQNGDGERERERERNQAQPMRADQGAAKQHLGDHPDSQSAHSGHEPAEDKPAQLTARLGIAMDTVAADRSRDG